MMQKNIGLSLSRHDKPCLIEVYSLPITSQLELLCKAHGKEKKQLKVFRDAKINHGQGLPSPLSSSSFLPVLLHKRSLPDSRDRGATLSCPTTFFLNFHCVFKIRFALGWLGVG